MTTTPEDPHPHPDIVPSGDPTPIPTPDPGENPETDEVTLPEEDEEDVTDPVEVSRPIDPTGPGTQSGLH